MEDKENEKNRAMKYSEDVVFIGEKTNSLNASSAALTWSKSGFIYLQIERLKCCELKYDGKRKLSGCKSLG